MLKLCHFIFVGLSIARDLALLFKQLGASCRELSFEPVICQRCGGYRVAELPSKLINLACFNLQVQNRAFPLIPRRGQLFTQLRCVHGLRQGHFQLLPKILELALRRRSLGNSLCSIAFCSNQICPKLGGLLLALRLHSFQLGVERHLRGGQLFSQLLCFGGVLLPRICKGEGVESGCVFQFLLESCVRCQLLSERLLTTRNSAFDLIEPFAESLHLISSSVRRRGGLIQHSPALLLCFSRRFICCCERCRNMLIGSQNFFLQCRCRPFVLSFALFEACRPVDDVLHPFRSFPKLTFKFCGKFTFLDVLQVSLKLNGCANGDAKSFLQFCLRCLQIFFHHFTRRAKRIQLLR